jgi:hypothetical protein
MTIGPSDTLSALQNGVSAVQTLIQRVSPFMGGAVTAINTVGTTGAQVIGSNTTRTNITFHNPGAVNTFVYPLTNATGGQNTPSNATPGGAFLVLPGAYLTIVDTVQGAWGAFSSSATGQPLTILDR